MITDYRSQNRRRRWGSYLRCVWLSIYLFIYLSIYLSIYLYIYLYDRIRESGCRMWLRITGHRIGAEDEVLTGAVSGYLSIYIYICIFLSIYLFIYLSIYISIHLEISRIEDHRPSPPICLVCPSSCQSIYISIYVSYLFNWLSLRTRFRPFFYHINHFKTKDHRNLLHMLYWSIVM